MTSRRKSMIVGQFTPHRVEMIESPAWRVLSLSARRVLDRIEVELCHHGGHNENGRLPVTYDDFERYGTHVNAIAPAIREVVALGLVVVTEQGRGGNSEFRKPSKYRLTYVHTKPANPSAKYPDPPTDDWKSIETIETAEHLATTAREARSRPPRKQKPALGKRSVSPSENEGGNGKVPPSEKGGTVSLRKTRVLSISPGGEALPEQEPSSSSSSALLPACLPALNETTEKKRKPAEMAARPEDGTSSGADRPDWFQPPAGWRYRNRTS